MGIAATRATNAEAVSLDSLRTHVGVYDSSFDSQLVDLAAAALDMVEVETGRAVVTQTVTLTLDGFPCVIPLPRSPLSSVTSIEYVDSAGATQTLASSVYRVTGTGDPARITLARNQSWPGVDAVSESVTVTYVAGYGDKESEIPAGLRQAILMLVGHWFDNRNAVDAGGSREVPIGAMRLMKNWKLGWHAAADGMMGVA